MVPRKVGEQLKARRLQLHMHQPDVADALGVSRAYIGAVENGVDWDPDAEKLIGWAVLLDLDPAELLRSLGRSTMSADAMPVIEGGLTPALLAAIRREVAAGVALGLREARRDAQSGAGPRPSDRLRTRLAQ